MRSFVVAVALMSFAAAGCSDEETSPTGTKIDLESDVAKDYLADLEEAGLGDLYPSPADAVAYVATACKDAGAFGMTPQELIDSGAVSEQAAVALAYCDTALAG